MGVQQFVLMALMKEIVKVDCVINNMKYMLESFVFPN